MKKILVLVLAIVMAFSVVALVACDQGVNYDGKCQYEQQGDGWKASYGCKVTVTVKGNTITNVKLWTDEEAGEGYTRTTKSWKENQHEGDLGFEKAEAAYADWLVKTFKGKTVEEVKGWTASYTDTSVTPASANLTGATQSAARIILAVQDALKDVK